MRRTLSSAILAAVVAASPLAAAEEAELPYDPYDDAMLRAGVAEGRGDMESAARELEAVVHAYPQDYAIRIRIAWLRFRAGRHREAGRAYEAALALSPTASDARAGLGWSLARLGMCRDAEIQFRAVLWADPGHAPSREGLAYCTVKPVPAVPEEPSLTVTAGVHGAALFYPDHPIKSYGAGIAGALGLYHRSGFILDASYQYLHFWSRDSAVSAWDQHEIHASVGYGVKEGGVVALYALTLDGSGVTGTGHHLGISARWSPYGDIVVEGAASLYDDMLVFRLAPSWRIPIAWGLSITPAGAIQRAGSETLGMGALTLSLDGTWGRIHAGGKYGDEVRPAYLGLGVVENTTDRIKWGLWAGASLNVGAGFGIHAGYSMERQEISSGAASNVHVVTFGLTKTF